MKRKTLNEAYPELINEWHPTKNESLHPQDVFPGSNQKVWWLGTCGHSYEKRVSSKVSGAGCPYCSGHLPLVGINDLATTHPQLVSEWHPIKNEPLTPQEVKAHSNKKVWWQCQHNHEWEARIHHRSKGSQCPYCSGLLPIVGETDLATLNPKVANEWHPTKNRDLTPQEVTKSSTKKVWWLCQNGHEWETTVHTRNKGYGCPRCKAKKEAASIDESSQTVQHLITRQQSTKNKLVIPGVNNLATTHPQLAKEWHNVKNHPLTPQDIKSGSNKKVWWQCQKGHEWQAKPNHRTNGSGCPYCYGRLPIVGETDLATLNPTVAKQWHPTKNGNLTPQDVTKGSSKKVWWQCEKGHEWETPVHNRYKGNGCPYCSHRIKKNKHLN